MSVKKENSNAHRITIDPVTRLEGHGKIDLFTDDNNEIINAYLQVPELRGFERFCIGRMVEDLPRITSNICGVCSPAHHLASAKAVDEVLGLPPTPIATQLRELMHIGYMIADHILNFYFLSGPDFLVGIKENPSERNIVGVLKKYGMEVTKKVIEHRAFGQKIVEIIGGKAVHPVAGIPGGISKPISEDQRHEIEKMARSCIEFATFTIDLYDKIILQNEEYHALLVNKDYSINSYDVGLVDHEGYMNLYDGHIKITSPDGSTYTEFSANEYFENISEEIMEWSYVKFPYLKNIGWKGLLEAPKNGIFRVGPLARMNITKGLTTPKAQQEYERMTSSFNEKPINNIYAYHWSRLIELMYSAERALDLSMDDDITKKDVRTISEKPDPKEGFGTIEAARGTLLHWYKPTMDAKVEAANFIPPTTCNNPAINISIKKAAKNIFKGEQVNEGLLNMIEVTMRAYDPCMACASHIYGKRAYEVRFFDTKKKLKKQLFI